MTRQELKVGDRVKCVNNKIAASDRMGSTRYAYIKEGSVYVVNGSRYGCVSVDCGADEFQYPEECFVLVVDMSKLGEW